MGKASVLLVLVLYPESEPNFCNKSCRFGREIWRLVNVRRMLSANKESLYFFCRNETPRMSGWDRMASARGSKHRIKSKADKGHPCLVPLLRGNDGNRKEDNCTWEDGREYRACSAVIKGPLNPYLERVENIKGQLSRSKAFWVSRLKIRTGRAVLLSKSIKIMVRLVLSTTCLVGTKPTWSLCISLGSMWESLLAKIFVKML